MSKTIVLNGSPKNEKGNTGKVLSSFIGGLEESGSKVELFYPSRLDIKPCSCGEMYCWYREPGKCCISDDMDSVYPELKKAKTLVLATPVYIPLPGDMQNMINRLCPLILPFLEKRNGRTRARVRKDVNLQQLVLLSTCGWWEIENFMTVERITKEMAHDMNVEYVGAVLRPHAGQMWKDGNLTKDAEAVLQAVRRAGNELIDDGTFSEATLAEISSPLISEEEKRQMETDIK